MMEGLCSPQVILGRGFTDPQEFLVGSGGAAGVSTSTSVQSLYELKVAYRWLIGTDLSLERRDERHSPGE
jgi:hypothetical protein